MPLLTEEELTPPVSVQEAALKGVALHEAGKSGHDVPWGTGVGRAKEFLVELDRLGIKPTMIGIEYSRDWTESMPKLAKCIEFFNETTLQLAAGR